jgi:hypothetical protein
MALTILPGATTLACDIHKVCIVQRVEIMENCTLERWQLFFYEIKHGSLTSWPFACSKSAACHHFQTQVTGRLNCLEPVKSNKQARIHHFCVNFYC